MLRMMLVVLFMGLMIAEDGAGAQTAGDHLYPHLGNGGYDVQHYALDLIWDDVTDNLDGIATLEIVAAQNLQTFTLDLVGMTVDSVRVDGDEASFSREGRKLTITPRDALADGQEFEVVVAYHGIPEPDRNSGAGTPRGWNRIPSGVYTVSEPSGAATWFPCNYHTTDKATYRFNVTVPVGYTVAATGLQQDMTTNGDSLTYHWEASDPVATYLVGVHIGDYIHVEETLPHGLHLRSYFPNTSLGRQRSRQDYQLPEIIAFFSDTFGAYPFESYGILLVEEYPNANEMQTLSVFNIDFIFENVMVHELAHQWFGNHVTLADWSEIWLNEGFATYSEYLWMEYKNGSFVAGELFTEAGYRTVSEMRPPIPPPAETLFHGSAYWRGAWTLHALRLRVGDDAFFEIMRQYFAQYSGSHASTDDFIAIAETISGEDLQAFFRAWLYEATPPPVPELDLSG